MTRDQLRFDDRTVVITGAGGGLGRAYAHLFADRGAKVLVNDPGVAVGGAAGDGGAAAGVVAEIERRGGTAIANTDSVATVDGGERIIADAIEAFGRVDVLVNNAGILRDSSFHKMTVEQVDAVLAVHLHGAFHVTLPAFRHMRERGYGRIVNTSSNSGIIGNFGQANYGAAKTGLIGLTRVLAAEGRRWDLRANVVAPAAATRMTADLLDGQIAETLTPEAVAPVVAFLGHESCPVSGEVFSAGGGRVARFFTGLTGGYFHPELTPELVSDRLAAIRDPAGYTIPDEPAEEIAALAAAWGRSTGTT